MSRPILADHPTAPASDQVPEVLTSPSLSDWIGRSECAHDDVTAAPIAALSATLDRADGYPPINAPLPPLWHWLYFLPMAPHSQIGPDGHPQRGGFLPPVPLPRRMWAGSDFIFHAPIRVGDALTRTSTIADVRAKRGRSGELVFVKVRHEICRRNDSTLLLTEHHEIVYRAAPAFDEIAPKPTAAATEAAWLRDVTADDVLLFRYSAVTFNGHRIHYDRRYVTEVEGYPGLVVHGPLIATLLMDLLRRHAPTAMVTTFAFRALRPTFDIHPFQLRGQPSADGRSVHLWASDHEGWLTMDATATLA